MANLPASSAASAYYTYDRVLDDGSQVPGKVCAFPYLFTTAFSCLALRFHRLLSCFAVSDFCLSRLCLLLLLADHRP